MKVLLSIKPEFAEKIFDGTKKFEFRRAIFKKSDVKTVVVYASHPIQKVIGEFEIEEILCEKVNALWEQTQEFAGIDAKFFFEYFADKEQGYAIAVRKAKKYNKPLSLAKNFKIHPPQSFAYI